METSRLEQALRDFDRIAMLVSDSKNRQAWRFEFEGRGYFLYFYPKRMSFGVNPALIEFLRFQTLQKLNVSTPRAVAHLSGFSVRQMRGNALIVEEIPGAMPLDQADILDRKNVAGQVITIIEQIGRAKFGHDNLRLDSFLFSNGKVFLLDVRNLRKGGMRLNDLFIFAHDARRLASTTELLRGWKRLNPDLPPPLNFPMSRKLLRKFVRDVRRESNDISVFRHGEWSGFFNRSRRFSRPWTTASHLPITEQDWQAAWPLLMSQLQSDQFTHLKNDSASEILSGEIILGGKPISVIVKRPKRKRLRQYLIDLFRPARAERMWIKAWTLIDLNLPCEWPLIVMQKKSLGYVTDAIILFERVPGVSLDKVDLDAIEPKNREMLFRRAGRSMRTIERFGLEHYDAKSTNWIVYNDSIPVMIDVDGVRPLNYFLWAWGVRRLLRAMKQHPQYTPDDSLAICQGYAPHAGKFKQEDDAN